MARRAAPRTATKGGSGHFLCVGLGIKVNSLDWLDCCARKVVRYQERAVGVLPWTDCSSCGRRCICLEVGEDGP